MCEYFDLDSSSVVDCDFAPIHREWRERVRLAPDFLKAALTEVMYRRDKGAAWLMDRVRWVGPVRPTHMSSNEFIWQYEEIAKKICEDALGALSQAGVSDQEVLRVMPVSGCFLRNGTPGRGKPKVTRSEVIVVLLKKGVEDHWSARGVKLDKLRQISETVQASAAKIRAVVGVRTYVLIYATETISTEKVDSRTFVNNLLAIDFDYTRKSLSWAAEYRERINFVRHLETIFPRKVVADAISSGKPVEERVQRFARGWGTAASSAKSAVTRRLLVDAALICALLSAATFVAVPLFLAFCESTGPQRSAAGFLGFLSVVGLIFSSEMANALDGTGKRS